MFVSIVEYLEKSAKYFPDKISYKDNKEEFTFSQLLDKSKRIGSGIIKRTEMRKPVVIYMQKKAANIAAFMGAVYAGCYYTPIDNQMPLERVKLILDTLNPALVITDNSTSEKVKELGIDDISVLYDEISNCEIDETGIQYVRSNCKLTDILYVLFTSGSTGVPKGVTISHLAVMDCTEWGAACFNLDSSIVLCNEAPFYFDLSVLDVYLTMKLGGTMLIPPKTYYTFPAKIVQYLKDNNVNFINWTPSAMCNLVNCRAFDVCVPDQIKHVVFIGEVMTCKQLNVWRKYIPDALYVNAYGPTEATYCCMYYKVDRDFSDDGVLPLGRACENSTIVLLDDNNAPVKNGEIGEICVLGPCLSNGYYKNPQKTNEVFIQNPINPNWNELMYKTGDLAYVDENGDMIFKGRKDSQIKRLGYRIELGEIENIIIAVDGIENACCLYDNESSDIIAVYVSKQLSDETLLDTISQKLPGYMLPTKFIHLEEMPMNLNGKIDRPYLKKKYIG